MYVKGTKWLIELVDVFKLRLPVFRNGFGLTVEVFAVERHVWMV